MTKGKCIYCKEEKDLNTEHAFPKSLLQTNAPGWTIKKHVCEDCNRDLGKLDEILAKKSPLAFISYRIQDELGNQDQTPHSSIYHRRAYDINPIRQFVPDPLYENRIVLHETAVVSDGTSIPVDSAAALRPQIVLMQYPKGQSSAEVIAANCEKFNNTGSDENIITDYNEQEEIYCILGNTHIFPPKTSERFFGKAAEFKSKFMTGSPGTLHDLLIIFPRDNTLRRAADTFYNSFEVETKEIVDEDKIPKPEPAIQLIQVSTDPKAIPDIERAIAKIAFHCFLHHYPKFSGHEPIFDDIREFIYTESLNRFVTEWKNTETENCVYDSTKHFHIICFFFQRDSIGCRIDFFTGLRNPPVSYHVILAGKSENLNPRPSRTEYIPFHVNPKSLMKRRIVLVDRLSTMVLAKSEIWTPN